MFNRAIYGSWAALSVAFAIMPATAGARQVAAVFSPPAPRVRIIAAAYGFVIAPKGDAPVMVEARRSVPIGLSAQIDRGVFDGIVRNPVRVQP